MKSVYKTCALALSTLLFLSLVLLTLNSGISGGFSDQISSSNNTFVSATGASDWTSRVSASDNNWQSVTYGSGLFVAVASSGAGNRVMTSPDGITWTSRVSATDNNWKSVAYGNGLFVAVSTTGTGNRVMTSPNGINWTSRTSAADNSWESITYGNSLFVAVSSNGANRVMTSPNGITWTARTAAGNNQWKSVEYGNGIYTAVSINSGNRVQTSPDGINWTIRADSANNTWESVAYGDSKFAAVSSNGTNQVMTSPTGTAWTSRSAAANNAWQAVTYGNGKFAAVSTSGTGNRSMTSTDGITWTTKTTPADNAWKSVAYGNGLFVAVSDTGTGNRVMTLDNPEPPFNPVNIPAAPVAAQEYYYNYGFVGLESAVGAQQVTVEFGATLTSNIGTNSAVTQNGGGNTICGDLRNSSGSGQQTPGCPTQTAAAGIIDLPVVVTPSDIATNNSNNRLAGADPVDPSVWQRGNIQWDATNRTLKILYSTLTIQGNAPYWLCRLEVSGGGKLIVDTTSRARVFFDDPANCPTNPVDQFVVNQGGQIIRTNSNIPGFFLKGSASANTTVSFTGAASIQGAVTYAPRSNVLFNSGYYYNGAVVGKTLTLSGGGTVENNLNLAQYPIPIN